MAFRFHTSYEFLPTDNRRQCSSKRLGLLVSSVIAGGFHLKVNRFQFLKYAGINLCDAEFVSENMQNIHVSALLYHFSNAGSSKPSCKENRELRMLPSK